MENVTFNTIDSGFFSNLSFVEIEHERWCRIKQIFSETFDYLLIKECPEGMSLAQFKLSVLCGESSVSDVCQKNIDSAFGPIRDYASTFARIKGVGLTEMNIAEVSLMGGLFSPLVRASNGRLRSDGDLVLTGSAVWDVIANAVGVEVGTILKMFGVDTLDVKEMVKRLVSNLFQNTGIFGIAIMISDFCSKTDSASSHGIDFGYFQN